MNFELKELKKNMTEEIDSAFAIYQSNREYFHLTSGKELTREFVIEDLEDLPPDTNPEKKQFFGIYLDGEMIGLLDCVFGYPDEETYYLGLLMIDSRHQRKAYGTRILAEVEKQALEMGYKRIKLGVLEGNHKAFSFWGEMGFEYVKTVKRAGSDQVSRRVMVMEKELKG